jgi:hypothetical protein
MSTSFDILGYSLVWKTNEGHGEVWLYMNDDTKPDITIRVQTSTELVAWNELLSKNEMKKVNSDKMIFTQIKHI